MNYLKEKEVVDSFQAFLVEGAHFTENEEYPIIEKDMVSKCIPEKIMPFSKAITYRGDLKDTFIYFYCPDKTFERIRRNPKKYINFFKKTAGIIGFDFSVHTDMPIIKQKSQLNDNLSLTYFYGNNGIPIIPSLRCGIEDLEDEYLKCFPKNSIVALGVHGFVKKKHQKSEWWYRIEKLIKEINPSCFVVIGHLNTELIDHFSLKSKFYIYDSVMDERNKELRKNGN